MEEGGEVVGGGGVGFVGDGADEEVGNLIVGADVGEGGAFHLDGVALEVVEEVLVGGAFLVGDELVAGEDGAVVNGVWEGDGLGVGEEMWVGGEGVVGGIGDGAGGEAEFGGVDIILDGAGGDDEVADLIVGVEGAGESGEEDGAGLVAFDEVLGGHGGGDFADAGGTEDEGVLVVVGVMGGEGAVCLGLGVGEVSEEVLDLFGDGAEDEDGFHGVEGIGAERCCRYSKRSGGERGIVVPVVTAFRWKASLRVEPVGFSSLVGDLGKSSGGERGIVVPVVTAFRWKASLRVEPVGFSSLVGDLGKSSGGERGIRTPGTFRLNGFQDHRIRPLCHLSAGRGEGI